MYSVNELLWPSGNYGWGYMQVLEAYIYEGRCSNPCGGR